ncbi:MAG: aspartate kinase [Planctomycetes bacterium RBG_13_44_8b]|nr:MAG: aspartate kinase [Planctomycetes bacterium RBG_13_44_8b]
MAIIVQKFGGTSVANAEKMRRAAEKVIKAVKNGHKVVVVASARGHQTDELVADALELNPNPPKREMDQLLSTGEQQTVSLFAMALDAMGHDAISFTGGQIRMLTNSDFTKALIKSIDAERIHKQLDQGKIVIVAGFQGVDENENITTLGRGGSDTTAVALAAALGAKECEIFTDVDGVYTTDPRIFKKAVKMKQISYDEMLEMASLGAGVMHNRSIAFGKKYDVKIHVLNSAKDVEGTIITHEVPQMEGVVVTSATIQKDMAKISLIGVGNVPGNAAKVFANLAKAKVVVHDIVQTEISPDKANLSFMIGISDLDAAKKAVDLIKSEIHCDSVFIRDDIALVSVIGVGMRTHYGVAERMFGALANAKVNIDSITTSEIRISCAVREDQVEKALEAVCLAFELDKPAEVRSKTN